MNALDELPKSILGFVSLAAMPIGNQGLSSPLVSGKQGRARERKREREQRAETRDQTEREKERERNREREREGEVGGGEGGGGERGERERETANLPPLLKCIPSLFKTAFTPIHIHFDIVLVLNAGHHLQMLKVRFKV